MCLVNVQARLIQQRLTNKAFKFISTSTIRGSIWLNNKCIWLRAVQYTHNKYSCFTLTLLTATCNFSAQCSEEEKKTVNSGGVERFSGILCLRFTNGGSVPVFHPLRFLQKEFQRWYSAEELGAVRTCGQRRPTPGKGSQQAERTPDFTCCITHVMEQTHGLWALTDPCSMSPIGRHVFHLLMANYGQYYIVGIQTQARWLEDRRQLGVENREGESLKLHFKTI